MEGSMHVLGLILLMFSLPVIADIEITTQIYDIDYGTKNSDDVLILLKSGHVAKLRDSQKIINDHLRNLDSKTNWYTFTLDDQRYIKNIIKATTKNIPKEIHSTKFFNQYVPTTIANMDLAKKYFKEARYYSKDSQCFNRAMVWSYEWWRDHSLKSMKIFIYFTRNYIRRYNFEWWFHIAPYIHVMENGKVVERVMDIKYTRGPIEFQRWANIFLRNDAPCKVITKFSDYADNPYSGECYFQRTHMYTYQPADLQMYEAWNYQKDKFIMSEVKGAYLEAFDETI
jgi:hypothetical protein